ncbi:MAG: bifunctional phosphopantothenoylcysteine decarboxylase/phosphopantothenate--cysteine ligase CoaBC [Tissierellia bacterium]|nr:bifunctional phosphopantothenoylcysteine decarboxylase/phosphopantothenate--cysteine ligase CoaBC [Tissierellia bacterium]
MWKNKRVLLGVTGGIAAYKAIHLASQLTKRGAIVDVVFTPAAKQFVTALSFSSITGRGVYEDMFTHINGEIAHIHLSKVDYILMVPATKNEIAKLASGVADNLLLNTIYASKAKIYIAPAMNTTMYTHKTTEDALDTLRSFGYTIIPPVSGILACKEHGIGKLDEPEHILEFIEEHETHLDGIFKGKNVILTGGPTISKMDPVRIFTNQSSGKMANALGVALKKRGANVSYIGYFEPTFGPEKYIHIETTEEMLEAVKEASKQGDIFIMCAAPLDYAFESYSTQKVKKAGDLVIKLKRTPDILKTLKKEVQEMIVIGFAAETENHMENGMKKLTEKEMDYIIVNDVSSKTMGMGSAMNAGTILHRSGDRKEIHPMNKDCMAEEILEFVEAQETCM